MKKQILSAFAILGLLSGCAWTGSHVGLNAYKDQNVLTGGPMVGTTISQLPEAVKTTLKEKAPKAEISNIKKVNLSGKTVYEVEFLDATVNSNLWISENGAQVSAQ